uniref:Uncharacterized protein n=1 Tax=Plectus sambesii TaxID=2011161 RepID=A0A914V0E5_9BILA
MSGGSLPAIVKLSRLVAFTFQMPLAVCARLHFILFLAVTVIGILAAADEHATDHLSQTKSDDKERIDMIDTLAGLGLGKRAAPVDFGDQEDVWERVAVVRPVRSRNKQHWHMIRFGRR